ncbi:flagellar hook-basal body complex protein FliE [Acidovorax sp. GBBC 3334]|uniref:flagellar hook-basal body complex protein FliE n=1 Tax=unclassified Acidovorax TaxID=2684926 RepID=UPI00230442A3|nr:MULTISPECIES: flagellar hook-basal body complex protein FliE [unclassified Acidovorax]MDA8456956.1 flagellar hook-basal body complex protein FliE [Acidovorax sp. GBBC 3334]MDA8521028.1 flagellar hook-basal body complex protein FliE [Acidovorax sp. NCPPB 4044]
MSAEALAAIAASAAPAISEPQPAAFGPAPASGVAAAGGGTGFSSLVTQGLQQVNDQLLTSQTDLQRLAVGDVQNLHQVMIRLEESRLSFQLMMQVRGRLLEAYQDVMKMQL